MRPRAALLAAIVWLAVGCADMLYRGRAAAVVYAKEATPSRTLSPA